MFKVYAIDGIVPVVDPTAYVHPTAVLIGDVIIGPGVYVGPLASLRGDFGRIVLKQGSNVQDTCVIHGTGEIDTVVEVDGHIGHGAVLHGCTIQRNAMVGMNAVVMDLAVIGEDSMVAAMAFVKKGLVVPPRSLVVGSPAQVMRELSDAEIARKSRGTHQYQALTLRCLRTMRAVDPLAEAEPERARLTPELVNPPA
ncbi:phenylacetic acid degradation protein PaaY [Candidimonas sp. SYP-B2681]|uniref:transferase hexapeptide repeat family protein n=1 Tax=Candidimonas sp. SYP-B2681 TaxID=2497686 RepID=UPI000F88D610|nr:transferase hexapeptide repeat family protein [Candidimonas sp. SYP-B2681]RTZ44558.1 phenylacetic acid degradation protein PaaY [Candidimonas sp. SYP-B2681]